MSESVGFKNTTSTSQPRQKPGAACEECRRRKLRCDRRQPQCGLCEASGKECLVSTTRSLRGPKRGYLKALQARIAVLEGRLLEQEQQNNQTGNVPTVVNENTVENLPCNDQNFVQWDLPIPEDMFLQDPCFGSKTNDSLGESSFDANSFNVPNVVENVNDEARFQDFVNATKVLDMSEGPDEFNISDLMQADLSDQLYFDRIHTFAPIVHQRQYFSWSRQPNKTEAQICLQYAMWTLAASVSAHYQSIRDSLYGFMRRALDSLEAENINLAVTDIEQVQAWLLLAIHEFMCVDFRRAWISAGRAFRLIQLNWFHNTEPLNMTISQMEWVEAERKRRTFWMAYCLDRFVSIRTGSPLTFSEQMITIRLPSPEAAFENDQPTLMGFLSEAIAATEPIAPSTFIECIIMATISGRALAHRHQFLVDNIYLNTREDFWDHHHWINSILTRKMDIFTSEYPLRIQQTDPMLLFISMMWRTTVLHLCQTMEHAIPLTDEKRPVVVEYMGLSSIAAQEIADLTKNISQLNRFKVHPLTSIPLSLAAEFFGTYRDVDNSFHKLHQHITEAMRNLQGLTNLGPSFHRRSA
ncbi:hypothetical protein CIHG_05016 [Coccidioides immitis H538.4]|uniref:Zn(2)-C6 fungal-type domain-containing protein n=1 Tax=Coccidioides immitis H538.4 TaxID=396776 RepID=A0A0J8RR23_COCIT|nr:hypothetical protein CIHG_05016 [Coccidioides immitis H538.4]